MTPVYTRNEEEIFLSDDVSFIIAHNRRNRERLEIFSLLSYTNVNVLPFTEGIAPEIITFLDPTIEKLYFEQADNKTFIHLKFAEEEEIILNNAVDLEQYLSSGKNVRRTQKKVYKANMALVEHGLVIFTWGKSRVLTARKVS